MRRPGGLTINEVRRFTRSDLAEVQLDVFVQLTGGSVSVAKDDLGFRELLG